MRAELGFPDFGKHSLFVEKALSNGKSLVQWVVLHIVFNVGMISASTQFNVDFQNKLVQCFSLLISEHIHKHIQAVPYLNIKKEIRGKFQFSENLLNIKTHICNKL